MPNIKRTPDNQLSTIEAAACRIREYAAILADSLQSDNHRTVLARKNALQAKWGIGQRHTPVCSIPTKSQVDEYSPALCVLA